MMSGIMVVISAILTMLIAMTPIIAMEWKWSSPDDRFEGGLFSSYRMWLRKRSLKKNREEPPLLAEILQELRHNPDRCTTMALHMAREKANKKPEHRSPFSPQTAALFEQISRQQQQQQWPPAYHYFYGPGTIQQSHGLSSGNISISAQNT